MTQYQGQGDYIINKLEIEAHDGTTKDIKDLFVMLSVKEDLHNPFLTAEMVLEDGLGLYSDLPIIGEEKVTFKYTVDGEQTLTRTFTVYRVGDFTRVDQTAYKYVLYMVSTEALQDANIKLSKAYFQQTVDEIANDVFGELESDKDFEVDDVEGVQHLIIPRWSPFTTMNWLCRYAVHPSYTESMFMFYENANGFHMKNLPTLYEQDVVDEVLPKQSGIDKDESSTNERWPGKKLLNFEIVSTPDKLTGLRDGRYASRVITVDNVTKNIQQSEAVADQEDLTLINNGHTYSTDWSFESPDQRLITMATKQHRTESSYYSQKAPQELAAINYQNTIQWQSMILSQLSSLTVDVKMYGQTNITVGVKLKTKLPKMSSLIQHRGNQKDPLTTADYLVTQCEHRFGGQYTIEATLQTNSFPERIQSQVD